MQVQNPRWLHKTGSKDILARSLVHKLVTKFQQLGFKYLALKLDWLEYWQILPDVYVIQDGGRNSNGKICRLVDKLAEAFQRLQLFVMSRIKKRLIEILITFSRCPKSKMAAEKP